MSSPIKDLQALEQLDIDLQPALASGYILGHPGTLITVR